MLIFGLRSTSDDRPSNLNEESQPKCKKGPLSHQKMKCLFLDYVPLLMIGQVFPAWQSTKMQKRPPKSSKNEVLIFGLCSTSDYWPCELSNESWQKCTTKVPQNDLEWPILPDLQLFQSFPTKVTQNDSEWQISPNSQLFQSFPTKVTQNDLKQPILPDSQLFQSYPTKVDLEQPILPDLQLFQSFPTKVLRMTWNSQFCLICNFSNLFPLKWLRMTCNSQFCMAKKKKTLWYKGISMKDYTSTWTAVP